MKDIDILKYLYRLVFVTSLSVMMIACSQTTTPIKTMDYVDLDRFMGDWYVIANIPTFIEKGAHNAIESYRMNDDGTIATTFSFHQDSYEGERKVYNPTGFVKNKNTNAEWGMRFIWPIKADYRIVYVDPQYTQTIIGRNARDYVWIMARTSTIPEDDYNSLVKLIKEQGYDISQLNRVPQKW